MKNHMNKVLALLVALLVLCAPIGAMAEETPSVTLVLSNLSLSMGEDINLNVDVTARLDLTADMQNGAVAGTLTALAGADKAMKGGFTFDMSTMNLNAALEGASTAIQVPMTDVVTMLQQQMGGMFSDEQIAKLQAVYAAYMNLMNVVSEKGDVLTGAVQEKLGAWLNGVMTEGYKGQTTVTVQDTELTAEQGERGDMDGNRQLNAVDLTLLVRLLLNR